MKVFVQIVDTIKGLHQTGMIDEPVIKGAEIDNALKHFGVSYAGVNWIFNQNNTVKYGEITGTSKVVSVITI